MLMSTDLAQLTAKRLFVNHFGPAGLTSVVLKERGWEETDNERDAELVFASVERLRDVYSLVPERFSQPGFKVSHFRCHGQITRKDMLAYHVREHAKASRRAADCSLDFSFLPTTYFLPMEYSQIPKKGVYIVKPACMSRGARIFVATYSELARWFEKSFTEMQSRKKALDMSNDDSSEYIYIVQQYVSPPLTLFGHKFDCRIYVLVRSFQPLDAWVCELAFARVASQAYDDTRERLAALTNVSVNKSNNPDMLKIQLWQAAELLDQLAPGKFREACRSAETVMIRCMQCCASSIIQETACFELLGFDILFDSNFKPYVMEANASPSLSVDGDDDRALKMRMMHDLLTLLYYDGRETEVGCFRQIYHGSVPKDYAKWDDGVVSSAASISDFCPRIVRLIE